MAKILIKDATIPCDRSDCWIPARVYAGGKYSGDWAGKYCPSHIPDGFVIWDEYEYDLSEYAQTSTTYGRGVW